MTRQRAKPSPDGRADKGAAKLRQCLRCQTAFLSEWAGERICSRCKSTTTWRSGMPHRPFASNGRQ